MGGECCLKGFEYLYGGGGVGEAFLLRMEKSRGASSNDVLGRVLYILGGDTGGLVWELLNELCLCSFWVLTLSACVKYSGVECFLNLGWTSLKELLRTAKPVGGEVCILGDTSLSDEEEWPLSTMVAARERTSSGDSGITSELAISITRGGNL